MGATGATGPTGATGATGATGPSSATTIACGVFVVPDGGCAPTFCGCPVGSFAVSGSFVISPDPPPGTVITQTASGPSILPPGWTMTFCDQGPGDTVVFTVARDVVCIP